MSDYQNGAAQAATERRWHSEVTRRYLHRLDHMMPPDTSLERGHELIGRLHDYIERQWPLIYYGGLIVTGDSFHKEYGATELGWWVRSQINLGRNKRLKTTLLTHGGRPDKVLNQLLPSVVFDVMHQTDPRAPIRRDKQIPVFAKVRAGQTISE